MGDRVPTGSLFWNLPLILAFLFLIKIDFHFVITRFLCVNLERNINTVDSKKEIKIAITLLLKTIIIYTLAYIFF